MLTGVSAFSAEDADRETYIYGSPYVALDIEHPFTRYIFIDKDPIRIAQLREVAKEYGERRNIKIIPDDAASAIGDFLTDDEIDWITHRAVIFLDPFGMQVPWKTIEAIARNGKIEIILNLPVGTAIQRLLPQSGEFSDEQRERLTEYFGSSEWEEVIYERSTDLFGDTDVTKIENSGARLAEWYRNRLQNAFGFSPLPRLIRNSTGGHLYYLLFAGPNQTGAKIAAHVLKQGQIILHQL